MSEYIPIRDDQGNIIGGLTPKAMRAREAQGTAEDAYEAILEAVDRNESKEAVEALSERYDVLQAQADELWREAEEPQDFDQTGREFGPRWI